MGVMNDSPLSFGNKGCEPNNDVGSDVINVDDVAPAGQTIKRS
jgi:hypothetical protein